MTTTTIDPAAAMGVVTLRVGDLENMSSYYGDAFGFTPLEERTSGREVLRVLGRGRTPLVRLIHTPDLPVGDARDAGLYHTAFLFETAPDLAAAVYSAAQDPRTRFAGSADHLVSEAFYFTDPEGNGVELYTDRPRDLWQWQHGQIQMDALPLDPNEYVRTHVTEAAIRSAGAAPASVGHVHLQVGEIARAREFYVDLLGFEATVSTYPGALFASAGGYHHHVAMNTWRSAGAGPRAARLGLGDVSITVSSRDDLDAIADRLRRRGVAADDDGRSLRATDPWGTQVTVALPDATADDLLT